MADTRNGVASATRITVLISGSGSNLQAIINALNTPALPNANIVKVISDRKSAYGLTRAQAAGIPTTHHGVLPYKKKFPDDSPDPQFQEARRAYDADLAQLVLADSPDIVVCAGFMRILSTAFLDPVKTSNTPIINLHPSLHGDLIGANCIEMAWNEFQAGKRTKTGIMIHYVIAEVDMGEPIVQEEIDMQGCETLEALQERIHMHEHGLIVKGAKIAIDALEKAGKA